MAQIGQRDRIEVVVGQRHEPEAAPAQLDDLARRRCRRARCRGFWPSVRQTEQNEQCFGQPRTVCTEPHMYRPSRQQVPARRHEAVGVDASALVGPLQRAAAPRARARAARSTSPSPRTTACAPPSSCASSGYSVAWMPPNTTVAPRALASVPIS